MAQCVADDAAPANPLVASYLPPLRATPLRISTMTATGHVGRTIDLGALFAQVDALLLPHCLLAPGVLKMEYKGEVKGASSRNLLAAVPLAADRKTFYNQATVVLRWPTGPSTWKEVNIKLFHNGGVQMTGVNAEALGKAACGFLLRAIHAACATPPVFGLVGDADAPPALQRYDTQMVNSDYNVGAPLLRYKLHRVLVETYGLFSTFEPTVYQGVNTKFFYNASRPSDAPPGICVCPALCPGSGRGDGVGQCKRITISLFQTGGVIITGARSVAQLDAAYAFTNEVLERHAEEVVRRVFVAPPEVGGKAVAEPKARLALLPHPHPRHVFTLAAAKVVENDSP